MKGRKQNRTPTPKQICLGLKKKGGGGWDFKNILVEIGFLVSPSAWAALYTICRESSSTSSTTVSSLGRNDVSHSQVCKRCPVICSLSFDLYRNKQFTIKTSYMLSTAPPVSQYWAGRAARLKRLLPNVTEKKKKKKLLFKSILHVKNEVSNCTRLVCSASCQRQHYRSITFNVKQMLWVFLGMQIKY